MKPTLKCLITQGMALVFCVLFGQSVWAASLTFNNAKNPDEVFISAGQFESGFTVNGTLLQTGLTTGSIVVAETANACIISYSGSWIDLGQSTPSNRTIYFVDPADGTTVTDILVVDVVVGTISGTWTTNACGDLGAVPDGTPAGNIINADGTEVDFSQPFLGARAFALVEREFDLALSVADSPDPVLAGSGEGNLTHTFTVSKTGLSDALGVTVAVTPTLPAGVSVFNWTESVGTFDGVTWTVGDVTANGDAGTLSIVLTVDATATDCTDCVSASGTVSAESAGDTNPDNDTAVDPTSIETAAGGGSTTFPVAIDFSNDFDGSVTVTLTCNTGTPLSQDFEITEAGGVVFVVETLDFIAPTTTCEVSLTDLDGAYVSTSILANGEDTGSSCVFSGTPVPGESAPFSVDRANTCEIAAEPTPNVWSVSKVWMDSDADISQQATFDWNCTNASQTPDGGDSGFGGSFTRTGDFDDVNVDVYPAPGQTATCNAIENVELLDDAVESDQGCEAGNEFTIGSGDAGCTITNTVFFEGIPTLSQYGLAILVLLTLGVGLVSFRRYA